MQGEQGQRRRKRWAAFFVVALMLLVGAIVATFAYNAGVAHGLAIGAQAGGEIERGARVGMSPYYGYYGWGWHPWGFGFGFGFLGPLLFIAFWFFVLRLLFWGGPWRRRGYWRHRDWDRYGERPWDAPSRFEDWPRFEEWHRRAHDRMSGEPPAPTAHI